MNANDYINRLRLKNPKIFAAKEIKISVTSFEEQVRAAFEAGESSGKNSKSVFESLFGKLE